LFLSKQNKVVKPGAGLLGKARDNTFMIIIVAFFKLYLPMLITTINALQQFFTIDDLQNYLC